MKKRKTWRRVGINGKKKNKLMVEKSRLDLWAELDVMGRVDTETKKGPNFDVDDEGLYPLGVGYFGDVVC